MESEFPFGFCIRNMPDEFNVKKKKMDDTNWLHMNEHAALKEN